MYMALQAIFILVYMADLSIIPCMLLLNCLQVCEIVRARFRFLAFMIMLLHPNLKLFTKSTSISMKPTIKKNREHHLQAVQRDLNHWNVPGCHPPLKSKALVAAIKVQVAR